MKKELSPYFDIQQHISGLSFDLTLKGESKAKGIEELVKALSKDMEDTVAFGDALNDLEMLNKVKLGVAMGNACAVTKKAARYVTSSIDDNGIVNALKHFGFI